MRVEQVERFHAKMRGRRLGVADHGLRPGIGHPAIPAAGGLQMLAFLRGIGFGNAWFRRPCRSPRSLHCATVAGLRGDQHLVARTIPRTQRVAHQLFAVPQILRGAGTRPTRQIVRPRGIQVTHARVKPCVDRLDRRITIRTPLDGERHRAHAEPWDCEPSQFALVPCDRHNRLPPRRHRIRTHSRTCADGLSGGCGKMRAQPNGSRKAERELHELRPRT